MPEQHPSSLATTAQVVAIVLFTFIGYLNIGIPWPYCQAMCTTTWGSAP